MIVIVFACFFAIEFSVSWRFVVIQITEVVLTSATGQVFFLPMCEVILDLNVIFCFKQQYQCDDSGCRVPAHLNRVIVTEKSSICRSHLWFVQLCTFIAINIMPTFVHAKTIICMRICMQRCYYVCMRASKGDSMSACVRATRFWHWFYCTLLTKQHN